MSWGAWSCKGAAWACKGAAWSCKGAAWLCKGAAWLGKGTAWSCKGLQKMKSHLVATQSGIYASAPYFKPLKPPYHQVVRGLASNALACQWCLRPPIYRTYLNKVSWNEELGNLKKLIQFQRPKWHKQGICRIESFFTTREHFMQDMYISQYITFTMRVHGSQYITFTMRVHGKALLLYKQNAPTRAASFP